MKNIVIIFTVLYSITFLAQENNIPINNNCIKQNPEFKQVSNQLKQYAIQYNLYKEELEKANEINDPYTIIDIELDKIPELKNEILSLNFSIKNSDGFNPFVIIQRLSVLLPLLPQEFQEQVFKDLIHYNQMKSEFLKQLYKNRPLKLFIEINEPLEFSYEGLIKKYNQAKIICSVFAETILNVINEIAYTKESYAKKYIFIKNYLYSQGFSEKEIADKLKEYK